MPRRRPPGLAPGVVLAVLALLAAAADADELPRGVPVRLPATGPTGAPPATQLASRPAPPPGGIITVTAGEWAAWEEALLQPTHLEEEALWMLMSKVAALQPLSEEAFAELDRPGYGGLLEDPRRYARLPVRAMRTSIRVARVYRLSTDEGTMSGSYYWPRNRPVWKIYALHANSQRPDLQPLVVYCSVNPLPLLPPREPTQDEQGDLCYEYKASPPYHKLPGLEVAAVFFKIHEGLTRDGKMLDYPVLLSWDLRKREPVGANLNLARWGLLFLIILVAAGLFWYLRRNLKRSAAARSQRHPLYHPLRHQAEAPGQAPADVDPALQAAVENHKKRKEQPGEPDDRH